MAPLNAGFLPLASEPERRLAALAVMRMRMGGKNFIRSRNRLRGVHCGGFPQSIVQDEQEVRQVQPTEEANKMHGEGRFSTPAR